MTFRKELLEKYWKSFEVKTKEFLASTSLQGMKYIWNSYLPGWVQFYFGKIFIISVCVAINLAVNVFNKWQSTPVIIGFSPTMTSIQDIPFPAITVCNMNKAKYSKVANFRAWVITLKLTESCVILYNIFQWILGVCNAAKDLLSGFEFYKLQIDKASFQEWYFPQLYLKCEPQVRGIDSVLHIWSKTFALHRYLQGVLRRRGSMLCFQLSASVLSLQVQVQPVNTFPEIIIIFVQYI